MMDETNRNQYDEVEGNVATFHMLIALISFWLSWFFAAFGWTTALYVVFLTFAIAMGYIVRYMFEGKNFLQKLLCFFVLELVQLVPVGIILFIRGLF